jgi:hypothetical protein
MESIAVGDVIQIHPDQRALGGCFAVVTEVRGWGVIADVPVSRAGVAPVRLQESEYIRIGKAEWVRP